MSVEFEVKVAAVEQALKQYAGQERVRKALGALGRVILNRIRFGFARGVSPYGVPWKPPVLRAGQPLVDTGRLRSSINSRVEGERVLIGTNLTYHWDGRTHSAGMIHQFGATVRPRKAKMLRVPFGGTVAGGKPKGVIYLKQAIIPPRPFMPITPSGDAELPQAWAVSALDAMAKALEL